MKYRHLILSVLTIVVLMFDSCEKARPTMVYVSGDDKDKIDLKGTLMKPDMRYDNIYAELVGKTVYVYFNETVEPCLITLSARNDDVLFARNVQRQYPATLRIFMENEPTGEYLLYITNGTDEASAWFHFVNDETHSRCPVPIETELVRSDLQSDRRETGISNPLLNLSGLQIRRNQSNL